MLGLGDSIYQRAFIRHLPGACIITTWPELYADLDVRCIQAETRLRTQGKSAARSDYRWHLLPPLRREIVVRYGAQDLKAGSIIDAMARQFGVHSPVFDLPDFGPSPIKTDQPVAIVRPVTARSEWLNTARNPRPEYIAAASRELRRRGFYVVSVADLESDAEWVVGRPPAADLALHRGELGITQLLAAISHASVVVGGVGWIVPACIAAGTPLYVVLGGQLGHNAPERITGAGMDLSRVGWAWPERPCMCTKRTHDCDKEINGFDQAFAAWLDGQDLLGGGQPSAGVAAHDGHGLRALAR